MAYAAIEDVKAKTTRSFSQEEETVLETLLEDAAVMIDAFAPDANSAAKKLVSCRMVLRSMGDGENGFPLGTTQGSMAGLGYSQSFTVGTGGSLGELYLSKLEKQMLGIISNKIGSHSPVEDISNRCFDPESWWHSCD